MGQLSSPVPVVHYDHHTGWSLSHLWLIIKCNKETKTGGKLSSVIFYHLYPPCQWIHPLGLYRCKTEQMLQFATVSSNSSKTKVSTLSHISNIAHQILGDYLQLWESKKLRLRLTGSKVRFAHCSQFHHLHPPFDQQSQGTAARLLLKAFPAAGAWQHTCWQWPLCLQHTSALASPKPLLSVPYMLGSGLQFCC